jgi:hypothetical protein
LADMERLYNYIAFWITCTENSMGEYSWIVDEILALDNFPDCFHSVYTVITY